MKVSRLNASLLVLLLTLFSITAAAQQPATDDDPDEPEDYDVKARVVRACDRARSAAGDTGRRAQLRAPGARDVNPDRHFA
jgi:hypothetical protein